MYECEPPAAGQQPCGCGTQLVKGQAQLRAGNGGILADLAASDREIGRIGNNAVKAPGGKVCCNVPHVPLPDGKPAGKGIERDVFFRQFAGGFPEFQPGNRTTPVARTQKQAERPAAGTKVSDSGTCRQG